MFWEITAVLSLLVAIFCCALLYTRQQELIFSPTQRNLPSMVELKESYNLPFDLKEIEIMTNDMNKIYLYGALQNETKSHHTVLIFPNAFGTILDSFSLFIELYQKGFNIVFASYRGFDKSTGKPEESEMDKDVLNYYDAVKSFGIDTKTIVFYGRGLGVSMVLKLLNKLQQQNDENVIERKIVLENGSTTLQHMANIVIPASRFVWYFVKDRWDNLTLIKNVTINTNYLFITSELDELVHPSMTQHLFDVATKMGNTTKLESLKGEFHTIKNTKLLAEKVFDFVNEKTTEKEVINTSN
ncbi:hypothetical protein EIN_274280 [Entamoeba invadens IP1]|uniref:Peptidase S9 prolyl oligopeptidase catalytic domain-containing protein n=1 Tax=Entamoeba invadens IP1 TaxID=370355 RepID=A0A0A1U7A5_ENTIV|nr:hypothetical protein EIN_274280 [Entamoeba invadens IP1]ELP87861.1 hypothetical protein EIN_274280 [Entamoeba invadens IP1]|eukprot:XP_004254632.1 hypothetical protein EIN_274280 [Entamoeba invadens IP1]